MRLFLVLLTLVAAPCGAASLPEGAIDKMASAEIVILGEVHDNPDHHKQQAQIIDRLAPAALVLEMLTPDQTDRITPALLNDPARLRQVLEWDQSGWPDFDLYAPVFSAARTARIYGALVPRTQAREVLSAGMTGVFGEDAARFGLDRPLPEEQQTAREAMQMAAHCDALPAEMLPGMVDIQRLRDAILAREALRALAETGGPVVVITGNGHARRDWGMPVYIKAARPNTTLFVLGQTEDAAALFGGFDMQLDAPAAERTDPCLAFRNSD